MMPNKTNYLNYLDCARSHCDRVNANDDDSTHFSLRVAGNVGKRHTKAQLGTRRDTCNRERERNDDASKSNSNCNNTHNKRDQRKTVSMLQLIISWDDTHATAAAAAAVELSRLFCCQWVDSFRSGSRLHTTTTKESWERGWKRGSVKITAHYTRHRLCTNEL